MTLSATAAAALLFLAQAPHPDDAGLAARARALSFEVTAAPRLAGTIGSRHGARVVARHLERAGWRVEFDEREVLLSLPRRTAWRAFEDASATRPFAECVVRFDADAIPPGDVPLFSAWTASGRARGKVVDVGWGLRADYERLAAAGVDVRGTIALARYGRAYRGVKAELAQEFGCAGVLLYATAESEGAGRGEVWPRGPWKPGWEAQRGSIAPMSSAPGDPSTPDSPSYAPGDARTRRAEGALPTILCHPIGSVQAESLLARLAPGPDGTPLGPGPVEVELDLDVPRELRTVVNVIARLDGRGEGLVLAGSHRDAWVRGAHDSGTGTVVLMLAAELLAERARAGWQPEHDLALCFWDAEESGLIGSTEFGEAHAEVLRERALVYVNSDASVSGTRLSLSGSPGLLGAARAALEAQAPAAAERAAGHAHLWQQVAERAGEGGVSLGLPGSGSDFAVFLHHLGIPVLELSFGGNGGGQYHTRFDDFEVVDRWLDPGWEGHALSARAHAELLARFADTPGAGFDAAEAAAALAPHARALAEPLGSAPAERLGAALDGLAERLRTARGTAPLASENGFYRALELRAGLEGRPWYKNRLWTSGLETGYASETFPSLRAAAARNPDALERELGSIIEALRGLPRREDAPAAAR